MNESRFSLTASLGLALAVCAPVASAQGWYASIGIAAESSRDTRFKDRDCGATAPPALFGCGAGVDGRALGARGDFGSGQSFDAALGYRYRDWLRAELLFSQRRGLDFSGDANFLGVSGAQPVRADVRSSGLFAMGYVDLPRIGRVQPFVGAGVGIVRNRVGSMRYAFPGLGPNAATVVQGGSHTGAAHVLTAGVNLSLAQAWSLDVAYRYADLGRVRSDRGSAAIVRNAGTTRLNIAGTRARLRTDGVVLSLRRAF